MLLKGTEDVNLKLHYSTISLLTIPRPLPQMGALQSLLLLYSTVSSARLTSCLGLESSTLSAPARCLRVYSAVPIQEFDTYLYCSAVNLASFEMPDQRKESLI